jgi:hypothetical protein
LLAWCSSTGSYSVDGRRGLIEAHPSGSAELWEHRIGSTIVPLLLAEQGDLALHAAAVVGEGGAVLVCGPSGSGKSVMATALALRGHPIISDDGVVLSDLASSPRVWSGQAGVRVPLRVLRVLEGASEIVGNGGGKEVQFPGPDGASSVGPLDVNGIVILGARGGREPRVDRLDPVAALPALMPHTIHGGRSRLPRTFALAACLAERVPVFKARLPDDLAAVGRASATIVREVARP